MNSNFLQCLIFRILNIFDFLYNNTMGFATISIKKNIDRFVLTFLSNKSDFIDEAMLKFEFLQEEELYDDDMLFIYRSLGLTIYIF